MVLIVGGSNKPEKDGGGGMMKTTTACPSCGYRIQYEQLQEPTATAAAAGGSTSSAFEELVGLPAGVKFDPTDQELLEHLEGKARADPQRLHPLIDEFIPTIEGEDGICYTHPEKLPGVRQDGLVRHFFHRPSRAYTTGTRKRRKVHTDADGSETRWHKTGKTRPVFTAGAGAGPGGQQLLKGYKKILVLYTNYGKQRKPEKTNWIMHQYHLGFDEEEKDGELVVSKVFYQTQPRQCAGSGGAGGIGASSSKDPRLLQAIHGKDEEDDEEDDDGIDIRDGNAGGADYYAPAMVQYGHGQGGQNLLHSFPLHGPGASNFLS